MADKKEKISVLFVCMGNICRSPMAEGVFLKLIADAGLKDRIRIDSAGTHAYHSGESPDKRGMAAAERRGYSLKGLRARRVAESDYELFDYILPMDNDNFENLSEGSPDDKRAKIRLFLEFAPAVSLTEVPDPYYGGLAGFERVLDLVEAASHGLLEEIRKTV